MRKTKIVVSSIMAAALMLGCTGQAFADGPESRYKDGLKNGLVNGLKTASSSNKTETAPQLHTRAARNAPVSVPPSARRRRSAPVRGKTEYMLRITTAKGTDSSNCRCL